MFVERPIPTRRIREEFSVHPCVALTGPRQCGKSTLAERIVADAPASSYFDLEAGIDRRRLATPEQTLGPLEGLVVIDEIQRLPSLFETIRVLVDRPANRARFLLLGSASPRLVKGVSESLAAGSDSSIWEGSILERWTRRSGEDSGRAAASRAATWHAMTVARACGDGASYAPSSNEISRSSGSRFRPNG